MNKKERQQLTDLFEKFERKIIDSQSEIIASLDNLRKQITDFDRLHGEFLGLYRKLVQPTKSTKKEE